MTQADLDELRINAYLDGELDAPEFERRLEREPDLLRQIEARRALRTALRSDLTEDVPSDELRQRILTSLDVRAPAKTWRWPALAASFLLGALLAGGLTLGVMQRSLGPDIGDQIVSAHIRSLMAPQATDVLSSDHHTVKPWFNGKLAFAPTVADLGSDGFPLVGARIDVVALEPVATLVYAYGKHLISVTEIARAQGGTSPVSSRVERGYLSFTWSEGGITYWVVSDAAPAELQRFVDRFRAATGS